MATELTKVISYMYPDLKSTGATINDGDFRFEDHSDGKGTRLIWINEIIPEPTQKEIDEATQKMESGQ